MAEYKQYLTESEEGTEKTKEEENAVQQDEEDGFC